jgi:hypothetical protein
MQNHMQYAIQYDFDYKGVLIRPGSFIKVKYRKTAVRYECILHNMTNDRTFMVVTMDKQRTLIPIAWMKGLVTLKRSRRNVTGTRTD